MRELRLSAILLLTSAVAVGQPTSDHEPQATIEHLANALEAEFECDIVVLSPEPRFDDFSDKWLVNYSASGNGCDEALQELHDQGLANDVLFVRRPTLEQLMAIIRPMIRSAQSAFLCRITLQGRPSLEPVSGQWSVTYLASGEGCDDAAAQLRDEGAPLQIFFLRRQNYQNLLR